VYYEYCYFLWVRCLPIAFISLPSVGILSGYHYRSPIPFILPKEEKHCEGAVFILRSQHSGLGVGFHPATTIHCLAQNPLGNGLSLVCFQCNPFFCFYRKIQDALEKQNRESFKKRDHEKRKVDEATEKAKELMRVKSSFCVEAVASINAARTGDFSSDWSLLSRRD